MLLISTYDISFHSFYSQLTNLDLYKALSEKFHVDIIASGGVSSIDDIVNLRKMNLYGAIIGKAYYTKAISIKEAIEVAK